MCGGGGERGVVSPPLFPPDKAVYSADHPADEHASSPSKTPEYRPEHVAMRRGRTAATSLGDSCRGHLIYVLCMASSNRMSGDVNAPVVYVYTARGRCFLRCRPRGLFKPRPRFVYTGPRFHGNCKCTMTCGRCTLSPGLNMQAI